MKEILLEEVKLIQLDILSNIHNFCLSNGIEYSLAYGTLLGAVRHKGYIPWDDDIDIMMRREDYERFIRTYSHNYYKIVNTSTENRYYLPFAKVCDSRTVINEHSTHDNNYGIYIDVFPIDNIPDSRCSFNRMFARKTFWNIIHTLKIVGVSNKRSYIKNMVLRISQVMLSIIPMKCVVSKMESISQEYNDETTRRRAVFTVSNNVKRWVLAKEVFDNYREIVFEGKTFMSVLEVDKYLTAMYGDYMKLPPEEKRVSHHGFDAYWK